MLSCRSLRLLHINPLFFNWNKRSLARISRIRSSCSSKYLSVRKVQHFNLSESITHPLMVYSLVIPFTHFLNCTAFSELTLKPTTIIISMNNDLCYTVSHPEQLFEISNNWIYCNSLSANIFFWYDNWWYVLLHHIGAAIGSQVEANVFIFVAYFYLLFIISHACHTWVQVILLHNSSYLLFSFYSYLTALSCFLLICKVQHSIKQVFIFLRWFARASSSDAMMASFFLGKNSAVSIVYGLWQSA